MKTPVNLLWLGDLAPFTADMWLMVLAGYSDIIQVSYLQKPHMLSYFSEPLANNLLHTSTCGRCLQHVFVLSHSGRLVRVLLVKINSCLSWLFNTELSLELRSLCGFTMATWFLVEGSCHTWKLSKHEWLFSSFDKACLKLTSQSQV